MDDVDWSVKTLNKLKHVGVTLAVDEFGAGYFSLSNWNDFPLDRLELDKAFIQVRRVASMSPLS